MIEKEVKGVGNVVKVRCLATVDSNNRGEICWFPKDKAVALAARGAVELCKEAAPAPEPAAQVAKPAQKVVKKAAK